MPGDMGEIFNEMKKQKKERHRQNLASANPTEWTQHTPYHWSRDLLGSRLDYWPSSKKFQYQGRIMSGDVYGFIRKRQADKQEP